VPGITHRLHHKDKRVHVDGAPFVTALGELARELDAAPADDHVLLVGRRDLRSNNSWMHNAPSLVSGRERCVLLVNPLDAVRAGIRDSEPAVLENHLHSATVPVRVTDEVMPGVVSLPHGWGHGPSAPWQRVAGAHAGVSANDWTDDQRVEGIVGQSIMADGPFAGFIQNGVDPTSVEGASTLPYAIPNVHVDLVTTQVGVPVLWWRSVGSTHTAYSTEVVIDEVAQAAGQDPIEFRLAMLGDKPRHKAVLEKVKEVSGWGQAMEKGKGE